MQCVSPIKAIHRSQVLLRLWTEVCQISLTLRSVRLRRTLRAGSTGTSDRTAKGARRGYSRGAQCETSKARSVSLNFSSVHILPLIVRDNATTLEHIHTIRIVIPHAI